MQLFLRHEAFKDARKEYSQHGPDETIQEVSEHSGVSHSFIGRAEKDDEGSLGCNDVAALARYYGVTADFLLGLDKSPYRAHDLAAACNASGLSLSIMQNIRKSHEELSPEAFSVLEYILGSADLSSFLVNIAYCVKKIREGMGFAKEVASSPDVTFRVKGEPASHEKLLSSTQRAIENERFRLEYSWIEFLKGLCDVDAARSAVGKLSRKEAEVLRRGIIDGQAE